MSDGKSCVSFKDKSLKKKSFIQYVLENMNPKVMIMSLIQCDHHLLLTQTQNTRSNFNMMNRVQGG